MVTWLQVSVRNGSEGFSVIINESIIFGGEEGGECWGGGAEGGWVMVCSY